MKYYAAEVYGCRFIHILSRRKDTIHVKHKTLKLKKAAVTAFAALLMLLLCPLGAAAEADEDFIKWVDFNVPHQVLIRAYDYDTESFGQDVHLDFVTMLAYLAAKNGNKFNVRRDLAALDSFAAKLKAGERAEDLISGKYYDYYREAYGAVFAGFIGRYAESAGGESYGLTAYFPVAKGFWTSGYDDFGNSRSFGFKRIHLGHDMFGSVGAPVVAVEGGTVAELGWNRYGGWRVGIRSHDTKRYYYYAHLRKNKPYAAGLEKGAAVEAGQVIGYLGATGYSYKENVNMKTKPHLHFGMQLIFDESQVDGKGEIWIDVYHICKLLERNRARVLKNPDTGEHESVELRIPISQPQMTDN